MPELSTETLPLLPLTSGVVLPGMVVTATLETPESRAAASAAGDAGSQLLLVPKVAGRYARVGTVAKIENAGELPSGQLAVVVRGLARARIGAGVAGTGTATWVEVEPIAEGELKDRIRKDVSEGMEKTQREFILRQQLAAIRKELGEDEDGEGIVEGYRKKVEESKMPEAVRAAVEREIGRLERTSEQNPEHGWIRTWLDTMTELPWGEKSEDALDITEARGILDADH